VSHELRTPLSIIAGYTDLLLNGGCAENERQDMLQRIRDQSMRLDDLIQSMLDLNRLESRRLPLAIRAFTVRELIASLRTNLPASWCQPGVVLRWDVRDELTTLQNDRGKLEMVLRNLIHNALKYTMEGSVTIVSESPLDQGRVVFTVTDTGPGISVADQAVIFEMFRQSSTTPPRGGGVGLGLYIVKRLTEALGGTVNLESREGAGARFTISLPTEAPHVATT